MKILIAEDDDVSRLLLSSYLRTAPDGYTVIEATNAAEAWTAVTNTPDLGLCVLDVMLPDQSGLDLLARIRDCSAYARLPVILCTSLNDRVTVTRAAALGVVQYMVKPFSREGVLAKVKRTASHPAAAEPYLEDPRTVCDRLHIDRGTYHTLLRRVATKTTAYLSDARHLTRWSDVRAIGFRANALKGAALNLGASALATQLDLLEAALSDQFALAEAARTASGMIDAHAHSEMTSALERVAAELPRLEAALARAGGTNWLYD